MPRVCSSCGCRKRRERYGCCENPKCDLAGDADQLLDIAQSRSDFRSGQGKGQVGQRRSFAVASATTTAASSC
eukprot:8917835-Alexandrium_andersonii.AAC.1